MKERKDNRNKWLHLRLTLQEYNQLQKSFDKSACRKLSDYARKTMLSQPVTINYRNQSFDEFMGEMIRLRKELNQLANNLNQAIKKLHALSKINEYRDWLIGFEVEKKLLQNKLDQIKIRLGQLSDQWIK